MLSSSLWWQDVLHTVIITFFSVAHRARHRDALALAMHRVIFARGAVRAIALIPYGIVTVVAAYSWRYAFELDSGWIPGLLGLKSDPLASSTGSYVAVIISEIWKTTPFMALLLLGGPGARPRRAPRGGQGRRSVTWQRFWQDHDPADEAGDPGRAPVPHARRLPDLRHRRIFNNGRSQHRDAVGAGSNQLLNRLNLGLGSTVSVLLFVMVAIIAFVFIKVLRSRQPARR